MRQAAFVYTPKFKELDLGPDHPLRPVRVVRAYQLIRACHLLEDESVTMASPPLVRDGDLARVHDREYIDAVRATSEGRPMPTPTRFGFGTIDNPIVSGMYEAAALVTGATVLAADLVANDEAVVAFNPAGGWHHAHRDRAAGFCIFNDAAVAIAHLQARQGDGVKVAYIDIDAHHGDGVQEAFYDRRDVLTISLHETTSFLFPWRDGQVEDMGEGEGEGYAVNVPLAPHTPDDVYLYAFREVVLPLLATFAPDYVVAQLGIDTHRQDPLTHMLLTTHGYAQVIDLIAAHAPRLIAVGGGGYDRTVVPRAWTLAWARLIEAEPPQMIPRSQARHYRADGRNIPLPLHDPDPPAQDPRETRAVRTFAEHTVAKIKEQIFPVHGL
jgi:acetoin utilization protein AcuC